MLGGMMTLCKRLLPVACLLLGMGLSPLEVQAQSLRRDTGPAEIPPTSFRGSQYVDSKGCVYIRAGVDGNVTWVPRVSRERKVVCGFQPSQVATAPAPAAPATGGAVAITAAQPENAAPARAAPVAAATPAAVPSARVPAAAPAPAPRLARVIRPAAVAVAEPAPVTPLPAARPQIVAPVRPTGATACPNLSPIAQQYMRPGPYEIDCGPGAYAAPSVQTQTYRPGQGLVVSAPVVKPGQVPAGTRVAPRHVYENNYLATKGISVPRGYAPAFDDGRLNPHRGVQTFEGKAAMEQVWTSTVPRRLQPVTVPAGGCGDPGAGAGASSRPPARAKC